MNYEKKYKEALEKARKLYEQGTITESLSHVFPELKESEDEKIRNEIIDYLSTADDKELIPYESWIAWLEKQGEQQDVNILNPSEYINDMGGNGCYLRNTTHESADKVEPKFKFGDKIRKKTPSSFDRDMQVARIEKDYYVCNHIGKFSSEVVPFSKESSYELIEQKPTWSDEDERMKNQLVDFMLSGIDISKAPYGCVAWLNSLKDRVQPKQEWSEKDEAVLDALIRRLEGEDIYVSPHLAAECLKSLKNKYTWKPSDEQMEVLNWCKPLWNEPKTKVVLESLIEDLKKLREE